MPGIDEAATSVFESVTDVNFQFFFHAYLLPSLMDRTSAKKSAINRSTVENV
jgi:hypothetical protein